MRPIWKGAISFGLVHLPVRLYTAASDNTVSFRQLHQRCSQPIRYRKWCPSCEVDVPQEDIVRGYEFERDRFVIIDDEDLEAVPLTTVREIQIVQFTTDDAIHPLYHRRPYYAGPGEHGLTAYRLLHRAMSESRRTAMARLVLQRKEHLALLQPYADVFLLVLVRYPENIRSPEAVPGADAGTTPADEQEMVLARELIDRLTGPFDPQRFRDRYRDAVAQLVDAKLAGREIVEPPAEDDQLTDLVAALEASLDRVPSVN